MQKKWVKLLSRAVILGFLFQSDYLSAAPGKRRHNSRRPKAAAESNQEPVAEKQDQFKPLELLGVAGTAGLAFDSLSYSGFGFGGGVNYRLKTGPSLLVGFSGQLQYLSASASSEGVSNNLSIMTLRPGINFMFPINPKFLLGGFITMDLLKLSAKLTSSSDEGSTSYEVSSVSNNTFGLRGLYSISDTLAVGGQFGTGSGSLTIKTILGSASAAFKYQELSVVLTKVL